MLTISSDELNSPPTNDLNNSKCICTINSCLKTCCLCLNACTDNVDNARILTLNCCVIKTNFNYPEFIEMINDFDILCLVETKTDDCDMINIPGYAVKMKNRKFMSFKRSGGILLAYKNEYKKYISELPK
jgi:hypothetical protein